MLQCNCSLCWMVPWKQFKELISGIKNDVFTALKSSAYPTDPNTSNHQKFQMKILAADSSDSKRQTQTIVKFWKTWYVLMIYTACLSFTHGCNVSWETEKCSSFWKNCELLRNISKRFTYLLVNADKLLIMIFKILLHTWSSDIMLP